MTKFQLITLLLLTFGTEAIACSCPPLKREDRKFYKEYKFVEDVFIGDVKYIDKDSINYEIVICEVFKGHLQPGQTIHGVNKGYCGPFILKTGEWMLLGNYSDNFEVNDCGLTTDLDEPWSIFPLPPLTDDEKETGQNWLHEWKPKARQEAHRQIEILRNKKPVPNNK